MQEVYLSLAEAGDQAVDIGELEEGRVAEEGKCRKVSVSKISKQRFLFLMEAAVEIGEGRPGGQRSYQKTAQGSFMKLREIETPLPNPSPCMRG